MFAKISGNGPDVILAHGLGATHYSWRDTVDALSPHFRTHALDLAGFGKSDRPTPFSDTMSDQAKAVISYIRENEIASVRLVGHSMGGGVCCYIAEQLLKDGNVTIDQLVLVSAVVYPPRAGAFQIEGIDAGKTASLARALLELGYHDKAAITDEQVEAYGVNFSSWDRIKTFLAHAANLGKIAELAGFYSTLPIKTLVIWGRDDPILDVTKFGKRVDGELPNSRLEIIEACGHTAHEEQPDETNRLISEFLLGM